jgi:hypothetical protein
VTYGSFLCTVQPEKIDEPNQTRFTVGGDRINYPGEVATPTAEMLVAKILFNSVISTKGARFMTIDISNFYLKTPLKRPEYLKVKIADLPAEIIKQYNLTEKANKNGFVFFEITQGMYGLPQARLIANKLLEQRLNKHGYYQSKLIPGLWKHKTRPIQFTLVVDDFGVKYEGEEHAQHLIAVLQEHYKIKADWTGNGYVGTHLHWDYDKQQVHLYMPGYVEKALIQFGHKLRKNKTNHSPTHQYNTEPRNNMPKANPPPPNSTERARNSYNKFAANSSSLDVQLTAHCSHLSAQ